MHFIFIATRSFYDEKKTDMLLRDRDETLVRLETVLRKLCCVCHICINSHIYFRICDRIFLAFFLSNVVLRLLNILATNDYWYLKLLTLKKLKSKMSKLCRKGLLMIMIMIIRHSNLHIYARNMQENTPPCICIIYAAYMHRIFRQIPHIFPHILPAKVPDILRKLSAIN